MTGKINGFYGDGAYDKWKVYETLAEAGIKADYSAAAEREDQAARQFERPPVVAGRGDSGDPPRWPQALEGTRRLSSSQPFGNGHVSDEVLLWRPSEKPFDPKSTNRNATTKQNPQQVHPPRTSSVRVELVNKAAKNYYLGQYDSPESYEKYARLIAEWKAKHLCPEASPTPGRDVSVTLNELILAFWQHAKQRYVKNGAPTSEIHSFRTALRPVRQLYGREPVTSFGPLALVACRQKLIEAGICRKRINQHVGRIRQLFKWGVAREMVPETVWRALCAVEGLRLGEALETEPVKPVPEEHIAAIKPFVTPQVAAMINLQLWSGCRPGEACVMRPSTSIRKGRSGSTGRIPTKASTTTRNGSSTSGRTPRRSSSPGSRRTCTPTCSRPEGRAWYQAQRAANRKTPKLQKQQPHRRRVHPKRTPGERYTTHAYGHAISRACEVAFGMPTELRRISKESDADERKRLARLAAQWRSEHCWAPNQLRHTAATRIRAAYGIEATRILWVIRRQ